MFTRRKFIPLGLTGLLVALALVLAFAYFGPVDGSTEPDRPVSLPPPPEVEPEALIAVVDRDRIQAIDMPQFETVDRAAVEMSAGERVLGVVINGEARAYPINILSYHEIVNDVVGGEPVAVTWCPLCFSALVFSRILDGRPEPLTFGVSGQLLNNTLVMYDRQTDSLWSQLYGAAVGGDLSGRSLGMFPSVIMEWDAWQRAYPDALVLSKSLTCEQFNCRALQTDGVAAYASDPYEGYYRSPAFGVIDAQIPRNLDDAGPKKRVLGIRVGEHTRAYPFDLLLETPIVNDQLGGTPVVIWFDVQEQLGLAYSRLQGGQVLDFRSDPDRPGIIVDQQTDTRWQAATGDAVEGPLHSQRLTAIAATSSFEYGWFDHFPESDLYKPVFP